MRIAVLGAGAAAGAILAGLASAGVPVGDLRLTTRSRFSADEWLRRSPFAVEASEDSPEANRSATRGAEVVLVGVKPFDVTAVLDDIREVLEPTAVVVSIAAGVPLATLDRHVPPGQPVVRAMPNTPVQIGQGVIGISPNEHVSRETLTLLHELLGPSGLVVEIPECQQNALTALSGSGPAYVFHLTELMAQAGQDLGLPAETAVALARATVSGAGALMMRSEKSPAELREQVTSPNGTTAHALASFQEAGLPRIVGAALRAASDRAQEISASL